MKSVKNCFCAALFGTAVLGAAAQDAAGFKRMTLFEGRTIDAIELSGDFDVVIRQGTPNGVVLEIPRDIPVDTVFDISYGDIKWLKQARNRKEEFRDTVHCALADGMLRLRNVRLKIDRLAGGGFRTNWISGPKARAVITVGDLKKLHAFSKGSLRFAGKMRTTETEMQVGSMEGLDITAKKRVLIGTIGAGTISGKVSGTPEVVVKANTATQIDLAVDSVGYLELGSYVDNAGIRVRGTVDLLATRVYKGEVDVTGLKANRIVGLRKDKDSKKGDIEIVGGKYILERQGNTITLREVE